jgi:Cd2+/Zn2+-exporting ATPase
MGYNARPATAPPPTGIWRKHRLLLFTIASGVAWLAGAALAWAGASGWSTALFVAGMTAGLTPLRRPIWAAFRTLALDMNALMTLAVVGAVLLGEFSEGAMVVFLFALSQWLESHSLRRAERAVASLMTLAPDRVTLLDNLIERVVAPESVAVGSLIAVKPGERIGLDGEVAAGRSRVNQAPVTGEAAPVEKAPGDEVWAGAINLDGALTIRTTKLAGQSTLARIIELVREAQAAQAPSQRFVDAFARVYTPIVIAIAALLTAVPTLFFGQPFDVWFYRSLVVLLVGCPCALVIATPVTIVAALAAAARAGVLIKGGAALERAAHIRAVAFDKTGTLTLGRPVVREAIPFDGVGADGLLQTAASVGHRAGHLLSDAILVHARSLGLNVPTAVDVRALPGLGATGVIDGRQVFVGSHRLFHEESLCGEAMHALAQQLEKTARSLVFVGERGRPLGVIVLDDPPRDDARAGLAALKAADVQRLCMLTGDNPATAEAIGRGLPLDETMAGLLPAQKVDAVRELRAHYGATAMVGDGINDAPALAAADLGVAMGAGADQALETADVALLSGELSKLAFLLRLARATASRLRANVAIALGLKFGALALAVLGYATLWMAVFADAGAALIVIANGLRMLRFERG